MSKKKFKDEPQHLTQGLVTENFLKNLNIKYNIINNKSNFKKISSNIILPYKWSSNESKK